VTYRLFASSNPTLDILNSQVLDFSPFGYGSRWIHISPAANLDHPIFYEQVRLIGFDGVTKEGVND